MLEIGPDSVSLFVFDNKANDSINALCEQDRCFLLDCIVIVATDFLTYITYAMQGQSYLLIEEDQVFVHIDDFLNSESESDLVAHFPGAEIRFGRIAGRIVIRDAHVRLTVH